jgi:AraC-like DNA-binding protein
MENLINIGITPERISSKNNQNHKNLETHNNWELVYYTSGAGILNIGGAEFLFKAGDIVIQPPDCPHFELSDNGYATVYLVFKYFQGVSREPMFFKDTPSNSFLTMLLELHREYYTKRNNCNKIIESIMDVLYQYIVSWQGKKEGNYLVERFISILVSNFSNCKFLMQDALKEIPLSEDYFRRIFKQETNKTPLEYVTDLRIEYAKRLLLEHSMPVKEVTVLSGFEDPYYFSRLFKQITGKTPSQW